MNYIFIFIIIFSIFFYKSSYAESEYISTATNDTVKNILKDTTNKTNICPYLRVLGGIININKNYFTPITLGTLNYKTFYHLFNFAQYLYFGTEYGIDFLLPFILPYIKASIGADYSNFFLEICGGITTIPA